MSQDNVNINIQETNDIVNIVSSEVTEVIDINVNETVEEVTLNITEELIEVNINKVTNISPVNSVNGLTGDVVLDIPTATSDLTNDSGFITAAEVPTVNDATASVKGILKLTNDLGGTADAPTVPDLVNKVPYTGATADVNIGTNDLYTNKVFLLDEVSDNYASIHYADGDLHIEDADGHKLLVVEDGFIQLHLSDTIQSNLYTTNLTAVRNHYLPDASGTIALTSTRRNANKSDNNNINYCGVANGTDVSESSAVWTIKRLTIASSGSITIATATNVAWTNRETATYI